VKDYFGKRVADDLRNALGALDLEVIGVEKILRRGSRDTWGVQAPYGQAGEPPKPIDMIVRIDLSRYFENWC